SRTSRSAPFSAKVSDPARMQLGLVNRRLRLQCPTCDDDTRESVEGCNASAAPIKAAGPVHLLAMLRSRAAPPDAGGYAECVRQKILREWARQNSNLRP